MKTTIDIDEKKLEKVMQLSGAKSRKAAVDYALTCAVRTEKLRKVFESPLPDDEYLDAMDPLYSLDEVRNADRPKA